MVYTLETGRVTPEGVWPTVTEWHEEAAHGYEGIFNNEEEVYAAFPEQFNALQTTMENSSVDREEIVKRLMTLAVRRPDVVKTVEFNRVTIKEAEGLYIPTSVHEEALKRDVAFKSFEATVNLAKNKHDKDSVLRVLISDHLVPGLAMPYSLGAFFDFGEYPWMLGGNGSGQMFVNVAIPGEDNCSTPYVNTNHLYSMTDPEAIEQSLTVINELVSELFGQVKVASHAKSSAKEHYTHRKPLYAPSAYSPLRYQR